MITEYEVTGDNPYRGHLPGARFAARLEPAAERRALLRGSICVVNRQVPALPPDHSLPPGWADREQPTEAPHGTSLVEGGR